MLPDSVAVPPAVVRSPAEELATFRLPDGVEARLFACEPMVMDPVVATFDARGALWVAEFTSYMKDVDATDEAEPSGRVVVLHDDDNDGRADRSVVFADGLVLPRAVLPLVGGALVIEPPNLYWMPDADGDGEADGKQQIMGGFEAGTGNPEHSGNGLTWGLDHRIHLCNDKRLLRRVGDTFAIEPGAGGGQWGLAMDDRGRFYFNYNSDWLRCDLVPNHYGARAAKVGGLPQLNHRVVANQSVWPARVTPGVNRGYRKGLLKDWRLTRTTGVCSPVVYRDQLLPFSGDVFVCEPCGNAVRRFVVGDQDGAMVADNAYEADKREFLTSTDERFRPVDLTMGPDGALYVVDMYRGVIQHRNYVTSFLRHQIKKRGLEDPIHKGRIWRIVPTDAPQVGPKIKAQGADLALALANPNGAVRDLALRELVQRKGSPALAGAPAMMRSMLGASSTGSAATRMAALSALHGLGKLTLTDLRGLVRDEDPGVASLAWQLAGDELAQGDSHLWLAINGLDADAPPTVRWHAALAVGDALLSDELRPGRVVPRAMQRLADFVTEAPSDKRMIAAVATAAHPEIASVLAVISKRPGLAAGGKPKRSSRDVFVDLSQRAMKSRDPQAQQGLLAFAGRAPKLWQQRAVLDGAVRALPKGNRRTGWLVFGVAPEALVTLSNHQDERLRGRAQQLLGSVRMAGTAAPSEVTTLTAAEKKRVQQGEVLFRGACAACHQLDGRGQGGLAPPLCDSEWVTGPPGRLIRIALHGVTGPIEVDGKQYSLEMPGQGHLSDEELSRVLSYLRRAFGHKASCIDKATVQKVRKASKRRSSAWTAADLLKTK